MTQKPKLKEQPAQPQTPAILNEIREPLVYSTWDDNRFTRFATASKETLDILESGDLVIPEFPRLAYEIFSRLRGCACNKLEKIRPEAQWAAKAHSALEDLPEWSILAGKCQNDVFVAGSATTGFCRVLLDKIPRPDRHLKDVQQMRHEVGGLQETKRDLKLSAEKLQAAIQKAESLLEAARATATKEEIASQQLGIRLQKHELAKRQQAIKSLETTIAEVSQQGKEAVAIAVEYANKLDSSQLRTIFREAIEEADLSVEEATERLEVFSLEGFGSSGEPREATETPFEHKLALAKRIENSAKLKQIGMMAGRLRKTFRDFQGKRRSHCPERKNIIAGTTKGNNLELVVNDEFAYLTDDAMFPIFAKKFFDRRLTQYKLDGTEELFFGPVILCLDISGSTQGDREIWIEAVAVCIAAIAQSTGRDFAIIHFRDYVVQSNMFVAADWGAKAQEKLLNAILVKAGGLTDFSAPLEESIGYIKTAKFRQADIVFVTDGQDTMSESELESFAESKMKYGFTVYGVLVHSTPNDTFKSICDRWISTFDIANDTQIVSEVMLSIADKG